MLKALGAIFAGILVSFYLFPVEFTFLPGVNTKMMLAAVGLAVCAIRMIQQKTPSIGRGLLMIFVLAAVVSLCGIFSMVVNSTQDMSYASYIVTVSVWLSGALTACSAIKAIHGHISLKLVANYLLGVCLFQCASALLIDNYVIVRNITSMIFNLSQGYMQSIHRLYGIGAALDVAGIRFSAVIVLICFLLTYRSKDLSGFEIWYYIIGLVLLVITGDMIARTTIIGIAIGAVGVVLKYILLYLGNHFDTDRRISRRLLATVLIAIPVSVIVFNSSTKAESLFRFAFEGFFSIVETGRWQTDSNDKLETMIVFPDNAKTWTIGDGYFENPGKSDINFLGEITVGNFYMGTDIGYLRFIFYFGIIGLLAFTAFIFCAARACAEKRPDCSVLFYLLFLTNMVIWFKVATDLFCVLALMVCTTYLEDGPEENTEKPCDSSTT